MLVGLITFVTLLVHSYQEPSYVSFTLLALAGVVLSAVSADPCVRAAPAEPHHQTGNAGPAGASWPRAGPAAADDAPDRRAAVRLGCRAARAHRSRDRRELPPDAIKRAVRDWQGDHLEPDLPPEGGSHGVKTGSHGMEKESRGFHLQVEETASDNESRCADQSRWLLERAAKSATA